jgi:L-ascorbate metabolism protein UlaG (beta-lactamase superfamily)
MTESLVITRVTHSCHLIQIGGQTVLTDPWFSQRAMYHPGEPIALQPEQLPHLDAVVISHEHYDHCDLDAFRRYRDKDVPLLVAGPVLDKARKAGRCPSSPAGATGSGWRSPTRTRRSPTRR